MANMLVNPMPMGTQAATGSATDAMKLMMAKAYGSRGGRTTQRRRRRTTKAKASRPRKVGSGRKPKFGSPAWRAKYMKRGGKKKVRK